MSVDAKIKIDTDLRGRLSELLDRSGKTAPDEGPAPNSQTEKKAKATVPTQATTKKAGSTNYESLSDKQLSDKITVADPSVDVTSLDRQGLLRWIYTRNWRTQKKSHGKSYENWAARSLAIELERRGEPVPADIDDKEKLIGALKFSDWELEFTRLD